MQNSMSTLQAPQRISPLERHIRSTVTACVCYGLVGARRVAALGTLSTLSTLGSLSGGGGGAVDGRGGHLEVLGDRTVGSGDLNLKVGVLCCRCWKDKEGEEKYQVGVASDGLTFRYPTAIGGIATQNLIHRIACEPVSP